MTAPGRPLPAEVARPADRVLAAAGDYGVGGVLPQILGFLMVPVLTRYLTPEDYGIADVVSATGAVLLIVIRFGLAGAITRFFFENDSARSLRRFVTTTCFFWCLWGVACGLAFTLFGEGVWARIAPGVAFFPYMVVQIWTVVLSLLNTAQRRLLIARERSRAHLVLTTSQFGLGLVLSLFLVVGLDMGVLGLLLAHLLSAATYSLVAMVSLRDYLVAELDLEGLRKSLAFGLPMVPHHLFSWGMTLVNRILVNGMAGTATAGLFGIAARFTAPLLVTNSAISASWSAVYYSVRKKNDTRNPELIAESVEELTPVLVLMALGVTLLGPDLIVVATPREFHASQGAVPVLALALLTRWPYIATGRSIFFAKKTWFMPVATLVGAAVNVAANFLLTPRFGAVGSAWSLFLGNLVATTGVVAYSQRLYPIAYSARALLSPFLVALGLFLAGSAVMDWTLWKRLLAHSALCAVFVALHAKQLRRLLGGLASSWRSPAGAAARDDGG